jgi:hypothetical protein
LNFTHRQPFGSSTSFGGSLLIHHGRATGVISSLFPDYENVVSSSVGDSSDDISILVNPFLFDVVLSFNDADYPDWHDAPHTELIDIHFH